MNIKEFSNNIIDNLKKEFTTLENNYNVIEKKISNYSNENNKLKNKIKELELKNNELIEEIKSKSGSSLWQSMILQIQEKDNYIEEIKKDLNFYKRQYLLKNDNLNDNLNDNSFEVIKNNEDTKSVEKVSKKKIKKKKIIEVNDDIDSLEKELMNIN
jgi:chromosome segregation ATPase